MRRLLWCFACVLGSVLRGADCYPVEMDGLRLEVAAKLSDSQNYSTDAQGKSGWEWGGSFMLLEVAVRNTSDHPIRIPTVPYFPVVTRPIEKWGSPHEFHLLAIAAPEFAGKPTRFPESRFHPVDLAPGQTVLLERFHQWTEDVQVAKRLKNVIVRFFVSERFPDSFGWWHGAIETEKVIERAWTDVPPADPLKQAKPAKK